MTPERWEEVNDMLHWAMDLAPERRAIFLDEACARDDSLRHEVESLLAAGDRAGSSFLKSSPAVRLAKGTRLGDDEIQYLLSLREVAKHHRLLRFCNRRLLTNGGGLFSIYVRRETYPAARRNTEALHGPMHWKPAWM
jgi:hypothetical protein